MRMRRVSSSPTSRPATAGGMFLRKGGLDSPAVDQRVSAQDWRSGAPLANLQGFPGELRSPYHGLNPPPMGVARSPDPGSYPPPAPW